MRGNASDPSPHFGRRGPGAIGTGVEGAYAIGVAERQDQKREAAFGKTYAFIPVFCILMLYSYLASICSSNAVDQIPGSRLILRKVNNIIVFKVDLTFPSISSVLTW